jgi:hypothetical protein
MAKKVPVTSVTPASKVKATSKEQQARTRNLVMGIATATPAGKAVKAVASTGKVIRKIQGKQMVARTKKAVNTVADIQQKVKAETIAKNSVKTKSGITTKERAEKNSIAKAKADTAKSGAAARYEAGKVEAKRQLPSKVVKINSKNK